MSDYQDNAVDTTLAERGSRYGKFVGHAAITQGLKDFMAGRSNKMSKQEKELLSFQLEQKWYNLDPDQKEALEMIAHKIGRILNGDPNYADSWHDIAGYAKLVDDRLNGKVQ